VGIDWLRKAQHLWDQREFSLALHAFLQGQHLTTDSLGLVTNVAELLVTLRRVPEALAMLEQAVSVDPSYLPLHANLLTNALYGHGQTARRVAQRHFSWGKLFSQQPVIEVPSSGPRLRVGYVSSNFNFNPEAFFALPLIEHHDRKAVEVYCYSSGRPDLWTARFRKAADHWRDVSKMSDEQAAKRIQRDRIQILSDLSGHFGHGRLALFALRPAPVQVSFPTYPATTGLSSIQYRITDRLADPPGMTESLHSEQLVRVSGCFYCYVPPEHSPTVNKLPAPRKGYITFGVFNRPQKITDRMLRLWARIMNRTPGSHILFHHVYNGPRSVQLEFRDPIYKVMRQEGIPVERIEFIGMRSPVAQHLNLFNEVDISLDTYPYHGLTTTCESLWMGVPVVTLAGPSHVARTGVSVNASVGLDDWVAHSEAGYARIAVNASRDLDTLSRLRSDLRGRMSASVLTKPDRYAKKIENIYHRIWKRCSTSNTAPRL
jgi:protein O-GlcNAc transferase